MKQNPWWIKKKYTPKLESQFLQRERHQKFYQSKEWQTLRLYKLSNDPLCEICLLSGYTVAATEVDHVIALVENYSLRLNYDNLCSNCKSCHSKKTRREYR